MFKKLFLCLVMVIFSSAAYADLSSPAGLWRTIDDVSKRPKSIVRIWERDGKFFGRVERIFFFDPGQKRPGFCTECTGPRKNKPIVGMVILWDLRKDPSDRFAWTGGHILDPKTGKMYNANMTLTQQGRALDVRGYVGISLLGRTQTWVRIQ